MNQRERRVETRLSLQRALLGRITPNLRGVTVGWSGKNILIRAIFETEPTESEKDDIEIAGTEVAADLPGGLVDHEFIIASSNVPLGHYDLDIRIYERKE